MHSNKKLRPSRLLDSTTLTRSPSDDAVIEKIADFLVSIGESSEDAKMAAIRYFIGTVMTLAEQVSETNRRQCVEKLARAAYRIEHLSSIN